MSDQKNSNDWEQKLDQLNKQIEDDVFLKNMNNEDAELADLVKANRVIDQLDEIGLQKAPDHLGNKLYAIADGKPVDNKSGWLPWRAMASAAAVLLIAIVLSPWQNNDPSAEEIEQARNQLAMTFFYLNKAADKTRIHTQQTIAESVQMAMSKSPFILADEEAVEL